mmetsp:Transcript_135378/g.337753  ORF Transcript_135378/g.337753 Transcript_135378/m.337753 type:complete len:204 (-) Transcript_135378:843-1454(-)
MAAVALWAPRSAPRHRNAPSCRLSSDPPQGYIRRAFLPRKRGSQDRCCKHPTCRRRCSAGHQDMCTNLPSHPRRRPSRKCWPAWAFPQRRLPERKSPSSPPFRGPPPSCNSQACRLRKRGCSARSHKHRTCLRHCTSVHQDRCTTHPIRQLESPCGRSSLQKVLKQWLSAKQCQTCTVQDCGRCQPLPVRCLRGNRKSACRIP